MFIKCNNTVYSIVLVIYKTNNNINSHIVKMNVLIILM